MTNESLGERLRAARVSKGLTQVGLAVAAGMSPRSVAYYEAGRMPDSDALRRLCQTLGVSSDALLGLHTPTMPAASTAGE